jgi:hypothetical protein
MTLTELADRVGVTVVNLSVLKNGRARAIRFSTLAALCQVLDWPTRRPPQPPGLAAVQGPGRQPQTSSECPAGLAGWRAPSTLGRRPSDTAMPSRISRVPAKRVHATGSPSTTIPSVRATIGSR